MISEPNRFPAARAERRSRFHFRGARHWPDMADLTRSAITSMRTLAPFYLLLAVCACSPGTRSGDFGDFLVSEIDRLGGQRPGTNALPSLTARWTVQSDSNGFEIHLPDTPFAEVGAFLKQAVLVILERDRYPAAEALLRCAFGGPSFGPEDTIDGHQLEGYRLTSRGGGIMLTSNDDNTEVLVIRPRKCGCRRPGVGTPFR